MNYYLHFRWSAESFALEAETLKKKLEDAEAEIKQLQESSAQQDNELLLSGEQITQLEVQSAQAHSRIQELETKLAAKKAKSKMLLTDYSALEDEASQIKEKHVEAELQCRATESRINLFSEELQEAQKEASVQCTITEAAEEKQKLTEKKLLATEEKQKSTEEKLEAAEEKTLSLKGKFSRAKDQVIRYKEKARSFYKQLSFGSWAWDSGWGIGFIVGFETFRSWSKNPSKHADLDIVKPEDIPPTKEAIKKIAIVRQEQMQTVRELHTWVQPICQI